MVWPSNSGGFLTSKYGHLGRFYSGFPRTIVGAADLAGLPARSPRSRSLDDSQIRSYSGHDFDGALEIGALVSRADHGAEAGLAFGHRGIADGHGEDAFVEKLARKLEGLCRVANHDRRDGRLALARVEPGALQGSLEKFR